MEEIKYIIFNVDELYKVDFDLVLETSSETVRKSIDETKTFVKWTSQDPPFFVANFTYKEGPYTHEQILEILNTDEWRFPRQ